jgi:hypothetical protein
MLALAEQPPTFTDRSFERELIGLLRQSRWGAASDDEVLATASRIQDHDPDSWVSEWVWTAGESWAAANRAAAHGRRVEAGGRFLAAASYYGAALSQVARAGEPDRFAALWRRHRSCWDRAVDNAHAPARRLEIPYGAGSLPGYFFASASNAGGRRPLVIMHNGAYGPISAMWSLGGAAAARRGYHWMTFDGPGQQAALHDRGLYFRPDWEHVLTPALDAVIAQPDVDPKRIAVIGTGQAGYWLPRALAYEHRLAAAVVEPGVVDVVTAWIRALPRRCRAVLRTGDVLAFDREVRTALLFSPELAQTLRALAAPYGLADAGPAELFAAVARYRIMDEATNVRTPILIVDSGRQGPWPGQSRRLCELVGETATPLRQASRDADRLDWLESFIDR